MSATVGTPAARPEEPFTASLLTRSLQLAFGASLVVAVYGFASLDSVLRAAPTSPTMCEWDAGALRHVLNWIHPHGWTVGLGGSLATALCSVLHRVSRRAEHDSRARESHDDGGGRPHGSSTL